MMTDPETAGDAILSQYDELDADQEHFVMFALDRKHRLIGYRVMSSGTETQTPVDPRTLFRTAMRMDATGVIVAHNHPSGSLEPSRDDVELTRRLVRAGELIGLAVFDHVVVAADKWLSLRRSRPALFQSGGAPVVSPGGESGQESLFPGLPVGS